MNQEMAQTTAEMCTLCPKLCRHVCTVATVTRSEADTPNEKCRFATAGWARGEFRPGEVRHLYNCCLCGLCTAWCEPGWDVPAVVEAARAAVVQAGEAPAAARAISSHLQTHGNPLGEPASDGMAAIATEITKLPEQAEVLVFLGCNARYRQPEIARAALRLLEAAGQAFTLWGDERCCGEPARALGFVQEAQVAAEALLEAVRQSHARQVVFTCPSCLRMVREMYPRLGRPLPAGVEMVHSSAFFLALLERGQLTPQRALEWQVTYHDPCALGRHLGEFQAPRQLLQRLPGLRLVEMFHHQEHALCCGAGGGLQAMDLRVVVEAGRKVPTMARAVGADHLVTACPTCKQSFARHTASSGELETLDVVEVLAASL